MAVLIDSFGTSGFSLSFSDGKGLVHGYEDDANNWIPITYETRIHQQTYTSDPQYRACLNMQEIAIMFAKFDRMIQEKQATNTFKKVYIAAFEFFYELEFEGKYAYAPRTCRNEPSAPSQRTGSCFV